MIMVTWIQTALYSTYSYITESNNEDKKNKGIKKCCKKKT